MSEDAERLGARPPGFGWLAHLLAVLLEIGMLAAFVGEGSKLGVALWFAYFYWSATCAAVFRFRS